MRRRELGQLLTGAGVAGIALEATHAVDVRFRSAPAVVRTFVSNVPSRADAIQARATINANHANIDNLGGQGRVSEAPAAMRDNPNLAPAYDTKRRVEAADAAERKVWQIHFPVDAAIAGLSAAATVVGGILRARAR